MSDDSDKADERSEMWSSELDASDGPDATDATNAKNARDDSDAKAPIDATDAVGADDTMRAMDTTEWDVDSIRDAWNPNSIRLPDSIQDTFASEYKRLDWQLEQSEAGFAFSKDRYYKPLVVALGLATLQELDTDEITDRVEAMEQATLLDDKT